MTMISRGETSHTRSTSLVPDFLGKVAGRFNSYVSRSRVERQLEQLDDRLLLDIGLKRSDIRRMVWGN